MRKQAIENIQGSRNTLRALQQNGQPQAIVSERQVLFQDLGTFWLDIQKDSLHIKAPVVEGVTEENLSQGLGHHKTTAFPNTEGGNVVISGHRWKYGSNPAYKIFEYLDDLTVGDTVTVHYNQVKYSYIITDQRTVDDDDVSILKQTEQANLTLYTCTPKYTALKRLVYTAVLSSYSTDEE